MIRTFGNKTAEDIYHGDNTRNARKLPTLLHAKARRLLDQLNAAPSLNFMKIPPGNRLEKLAGDLENFWSIRINDQWRDIFKWEDDDAIDVSIKDYLITTKVQQKILLGRYLSQVAWHNPVKLNLQEIAAMTKKNTIHFQKGTNLFDVLSQYGTEEKCRAELFRLRWPHGFQCPHCEHTQYCEIPNRNLFQCKNCRKQTSVMSGTIFDSTKLPLPKWFLGIYFVTQSKDGISSLNLARTIGISANAALRMKHKIQQVMKEREDSQPIGGSIQIDDCYWGGERHDGNRGRGATAKIPFVAALSTNSQGHPLYIRFSQLHSFTKQEITDWAKQHIRPGSDILSDGLNCFPGVKDAGCHHTAVVTGGGPKSIEKEEFKWLNTVIGNVKNSIHGTYHAVSPKHFGRYLAEFCYRFNRRFELDKLLARFTFAALRTPPLPGWALATAEF